MLVEKGVSVDEIKLYGEPESNDALDDSSLKDSFSDLEQVITKVVTNDFGVSLSVDICQKSIMNYVIYYCNISSSALI